MKEIVYTIIFSILAIILIVLLIYMFGRKDAEETMSGSATFTPGIYTTSLILDQKQIDLQVTVSESGPSAVTLAGADETVTARYPLLETCTEDISKQLAGGTSLNNIEYTSSNQYTMALLVEAVNNALQKAAP